MQDINYNLFDTENIPTIEKLENDENLKAFQEKLGINLKEDFAGTYLENNENVPVLDTSLKTSKVQEDIKEQKAFEKNKLKAAIFDSLFENEQQLYFNEHKHIMPSKEKKRLKSILIKKISNGDIYMNKVGKIIIRKGRNRK